MFTQKLQRQFHYTHWNHYIQNQFKYIYIVLTQSLLGIEVYGMLSPRYVIFMDPNINCSSWTYTGNYQYVSEYLTKMISTWLNRLLRPLLRSCNNESSVHCSILLFGQGHWQVFLMVALMQLFYSKQSVSQLLSGYFRIIKRCILGLLTNDRHHDHWLLSRFS